MTKGKLYLEKNKTLGCTFACLQLNRKVYRFGISNKIIGYLAIRKTKGYDYVVTQQWDDGSQDEEYYEFKYLFSKFGVPFKKLEPMQEVRLG